jgi:heme/copper-type cytochrome/quinol oxidase subunit 4
MEKKTLLLFLAACTLCCTAGFAKNRTVTEEDSVGNVKRTIEVSDTVINGKTVTDTLSITTYNTGSGADHNGKVKTYTYGGFNLDEFTDGNTNWDDMSNGLKTITVLAIIFIFALPVIAILIALLLFLLFRRKSEKAKLRLAEKSLERGQPIPTEYMPKKPLKDLRTRGVSNICLGLALFIFIWAITNTFALGCIGLFFFFTGVGQVVTHYLNAKDQKQAYNGSHSEE